MRILAAMALTLFVYAPFALAGSAGPAPVMDESAQALTLVHLADQAEIQVGQMALEKSVNKAVRAYAQMLVDDHTKAEQQTQRLADQFNVDFVAVASASAKAQALQQDARGTLDQLTKLDGAAFDAAFAQAMLDGHNKVISLLSTEVAQLQENDVRAFLAGIIPILEKHRDAAQNLVSEL